MPTQSPNQQKNSPLSEHQKFYEWQKHLPMNYQPFLSRMINTHTPTPPHLQHILHIYISHCSYLRLFVYSSHNCDYWWLWGHAISITCNLGALHATHYTPGIWSAILFVVFGSSPFQICWIFFCCSKYILHSMYLELGKRGCIRIKRTANLRKISRITN